MGTQTNAPLPEGHELGGYRIVRKISSGGFSIVYLAEDAAGEKFAVKEYLPSALVKRGAGQLVPEIPAASEVTFRNGLRCFFHPNVVRVVNFFRANETVYMVMAWERGRSLQELVLRHRGRQGGKAVLPERHVLRVFNLVMNGLREVHANRLLHLDLKPANIYLRLDGTPLLLDFGAARRTSCIGARSSSDPGQTSTASAPACSAACRGSRRSRPTNANWKTSCLRPSMRWPSTIRVRYSTWSPGA